MLSEENYSELREQGYTVVPDVITADECDHVISMYQSWLSQFKDDDWPYSTNSLIQRYNTGNMEPTWRVRLKAKSVFSQIWKTDKLLSSVDAIAIGRPPESGKESFYSLEHQWLHLDQAPAREGLHAYQGAVTLEEILEDDWTLVVIEESHKYFKEFFECHERAGIRADVNNFYSLRDEDVKWFNKKGLSVKRVPVPKGGMVLWDSRLVHANANPIKGRKSPGRWRYCVFVSMTPAIWSSKEDMEKKRTAYKETLMTTHWSSQGVHYFKTKIPSFVSQNIDYPTSLPDSGKTREAKLLSGIEAYDFYDGRPNGEELRPRWKNDVYSSSNRSGSLTMASKVLAGAIVTGVIAYIGHKVYKHVS